MTLDPEHQAELDALEAKYQSLADRGVKSPLSPAEAAHWMHKVASSEDFGIKRARYYQRDGALLRLHDHQYCFLNSSGGWVEHSTVADYVTGARGDISQEVSEAEAKQLARRLARGKRIIWD